MIRRYLPSFGWMLAALAAAAWMVPPGLEVLVCGGRSAVSLQRHGDGCGAARCCGCCATRPAADGASVGAADSCGCCVSVPLPSGDPTPTLARSDNVRPTPDCLAPIPAVDVPVPAPLALRATCPPRDAGPPPASFPLPLRV